MKRYQNLILLLILLVVGVTLYSLMWPDPPLTTSDSASFLIAASDLSDGRIDALQFRPLGYPLLLALTGSGPEPTRSIFISSLILHFLAVAMLVGILDRIQIPRMLILIVAVVLALPPYVERAGYIGSENLTEFVLVLVVFSLTWWYLTRHPGWLVLAGLAAGYVALVRPQFQLLGILLFAAILFFGLLTGWRTIKQRQAIGSGSVAILLSLVVVMGYSVFNLIKFDYFGLSPGMLGWSFATHTAHFLEQLPAEYLETERILIEYRDADLIKPGSSHTGRQYFDNARGDVSIATGLSDQALDDYLLELQLDLIREAPLQYLQSLVESSAVIWLPNTGTLAIMGSTSLWSLWIALHFFVMGSFFLTSIVFLGGMLLMLGRWCAQGRQGALISSMQVSDKQWFVYLLSLLVIVYNLATSIIPHYGEARYRVPTDALIILAAAIGLNIWYQWSRPGALLASDDQS